MLSLTTAKLKKTIDDMITQLMAENQFREKTDVRRSTPTNCKLNARSRETTSNQTQGLLR